MNEWLRSFVMFFSKNHKPIPIASICRSRMQLARWILRITMTAAVLGFISTENVSAQWSTSPLVNNPVSTASGDQKHPQAISDGSGGVIIVWEDSRSGQSDIYAQRLNSSGDPQWAVDGIIICDAGNVQSDAKIVSDGAGGAIITWMDMRGGTQDIYAQRVTSGGTTSWAVNGVAICTALSNQNIPMITADGSGGAVIAWNDTRDFVSVNIYAQRINSSGVPQWTLDGEAICTATNTQSIGGIVTDGSGGAIITWQDLRDGVDNKIYAQRISNAGVTLWTADGEPVSTFASYQDSPTMTSDGSGGAFIAWRDLRNGDFDLYAQRIDGSGSLLWGGNAVAVAIADGFQQGQSLIGDGSGGLFLSWYDTRGGNNNIYAQRLNSSGTALWAANGVAATVSGFNNDPVIASDGAGGIFISWWNVPGADADIFTQRIDGSGNVLWAPNGNVVCSATGSQFWHTLIHDGSGNAISIWSDQRNVYWDIYAQRIVASGDLGYNNPYFTVASTVPNSNAQSVFPNSDITINFPQPVRLDSLNARTIKVWGSQSGLHTASYAYNAGVVTINPDVDFRTGEVVTVSLTRHVIATNTDTLIPYAWNFTIRSNVSSATYPLPASHFSAANGPHSVWSADFNGDGFLDMAIANYWAHNVSIRLNDGAGNFSGSTDIAVGNNPTAVVAADFDGDGDMDIAAVSEAASSVAIRFNDGFGNFSGSSSVIVGSNPRGIFSADFDGDGDLDIAVANQSSNNVSIRFNDGLGNFSGSSNYTVGSSPQSVYAADFDGDGDMDIAVANQSSDNVSIRFNNGAGIFSGGSDVPVSYGAASVIAADFDGDGDMDIASAGLSSYDVSIRINDGIGNFSGSTEVGVAAGPFSVTAGDFNGDGTMDIATAHYSSDEVNVRFGNGYGDFYGGFSRNVGTNSRAILTVDLNGDGKLDLVTANFGSFNFSVLMNASGHFNVSSVSPVPNSYNAGPNASISVQFPHNINVPTLNNSTIKVRGSQSGVHTASFFYGDNIATINPDSAFIHGEVVYVTLTGGIIATNSDSLNKYTWQFTVVSAPSTATFSTFAGPGVGQVPYNVHLADLDGDGDLDMATANDLSSNVSIRFNDGTGNYSGITNIAVALNPRSVTTADLDGDGDMDLLVGCAGVVSIRLNDGFGNFSGSTNVGIGGNAQSIFAADFDADGDVDFATANGGSNNVSIRLNDGAGNFSGTTDVAVGNLAIGVTGGDVDHDGDMDLLASNYNDNSVYVLTNNGAAGFSFGGNVSVSFNPVTVRLADLDGDGDLDLVTANEGGSDVSIRLNDGSGAFSGGSDQGGFVSPRSLYLGDLDGDGDVDLAVGNLGGAVTVSIRLNDGSANFTGSYNAVVGVNGAWAIDGGDVDHDGDVDIVRVDGTVSGITTVLRNNNIIVPVSLLPSFNANGVNAAQNITVVYPEDMSSYNAEVYGSVSGHIPVSVSYNNLNFTLTVDPFTNFKPGEIVTVFLPTALNTAVSGNTLKNTQWQFRVATASAPGTFTVPVSNLAAGINPAGVATGDFNHDGTIDMVAANVSPSEVTIILNDGSGGILSSFTEPVGNNPYGVITADIDNDGDIDIVTANAGGSSVTVLLNDGSGNFSGSNVAVGSAPYDVAYADLDADGDLDLAVVCSGSNDVWILHNDGSANFSFGSSVSVGSTPYSIVTGDFDNDGDMDFATANLGSYDVTVMFNDGTGNFPSGFTPNAGTNPMGVQAADLDGDGDLDILAANSGSNDVTVINNNGSGNFGTGSTIPVGAFPYGIFAGDLDGDGDVDFATADWFSNTVSVRHNNGNGTFSGTYTTAVGSQPYDIAAADLNGDGALDLITPNANSDNISIAFNAGPPPSPTGLYAIAQSGQIELHWTPTPAATMYRIYSDITSNPALLIDSSITTSKLIAGLTDGVLYYFRIKAVNNDGESGFSNEDAVVPFAGPGRALSFDGSDDFVSVNTSFGGLGVNAGSVTMSAWIKPMGSSPSISVAYDGVGIVNDQGAYAGLTRGNLSGQDMIWAYIWDGSERRVGIPYTIGTWTHVTLVLRDGQLYGYKDGVVVDSTFSGNIQYTLSDPIGIGANLYSSRYFEGEIDEVRIWNHGLTHAEVASLNNTVSRGDENGLLALYHFDEGSGTTGYDASPAGWDGTLYNGPVYVNSGAILPPPSVIVVTNGADSGPGSLRDAIDYANAHAGADTILFQLGVDSVLLASQLPDITDDLLFINGDRNSDSIPDVVINGINNGINESFIRIAATDVTIQGLKIINFQQGSEAALTITASSRRARVLYNYFGTDGSALYSNVTNIDILAPAGGGHHQIIGNVISARGYGIYFSGATQDFDSTKIVDNKIGTNAAGTGPLTYAPNHQSGIYIINGRGLKIHNNLISGWSGSGANAINFGYSGFGYYGREVEIYGNKIGTNIAGNAVISNYRGINLDAGSSYNRIGDGTLAGRNIISGNTIGGLEIMSDSNLIDDNFIGVGTDGVIQLANGGPGIYLNNARGNRIKANVISGNAGQGVYMFANGGAANDNVLTNNKIGVGADGVSPVGNNQNGVRVYALFGYDAKRDSLINNIIAHNGFYALEMDGSSGADSLIMRGNSIFRNTLGGVNFVSASNGLIVPPVVNSITIDSVVHGQSSPNAYIQIFADSTNQGRVPIGTGYANGTGQFDIRVNLFGAEPPHLTAMQDSAGRTSGFSNFIMLDLASPLWVTSDQDDGSFGTLRYAINYANSHPGPDTIRFNSGHYISMTFAPSLPIITDDSLYIDGDVDSDGVRDVTIDGISNFGIGFELQSNHNTIRNLHIANFSGMASGIYINGGSYNTVLGCYLDGNSHGVHIANGGHHNQIGNGTIPGRNVIVNSHDSFSNPGILIEHAGSDHNVVAGNFIGTYDGENGGPNSHGVHIQLGAKYNRIGDAASALYNVISGNYNTGILIESDSNTVVRNLIGTDSTGTQPLGNLTYGIHLLNAHGNMIGDGSPAGRNILADNSPNVLSGAAIMIESSHGNAVLGNFIGLDITGVAGLTNRSGGGGGSGILINNGSSYNMIGDGTVGGRNVFGPNGSGGDVSNEIVIINGSNFNTVAGNYIGTDSTGVVSLGGGMNNGVILYASVGNRIGLAGSFQVISGLGGNGINIDFSDSTTILNNYVGIAADGTHALSNSGVGIFLSSGTTHTFIGDGTSGGRNIVSGNGSDGILIDGLGTNRNVIDFNYIGTDVTGFTAIPNSDHGVSLTGGAKYNLIGSRTGAVGSSNLISGNTTSGVYFNSADSNTVARNLIGVTADGASGLPNQENIFVDFSVQDTVLYNVISAGLNDGINITSSSSHIVILGNLIGTDHNGVADLGNAGSGIVIQTGSMFNKIGDGTPAGRNIISGNDNVGIMINSDSNTVFGNYIGTDVNGTSALGNGNGISVFGGKGNRIGGISLGFGNLISGNTGFGLSLILNSNYNHVEGNRIGTSYDGESVLGNTSRGVYVSQSIGNRIGNSAPGGGNIISANGLEGIWIVQSDSTVILGNHVGVSAGGANLGNLGAGIHMEAGSNYTEIGNGTPGGRNVIASNNSYEIQAETGSNRYWIRGNYIGTDTSGTVDRSSAIAGIYNSNILSGTIGGYSPNERNVIVGMGYGIAFAGGERNKILNNTFGLSANGTPLGDGGVGLYFATGARLDSVIGNTLAYGLSSGIYIQSGDSILLFKNSVHHNFGTAIQIDPGAQADVRVPVITNIDPDSTVHGLSAPFALVQIYTDTTNQGEFWLDTVRANVLGQWAKKVTLHAGMNLTALQDSAGHTSAFSAPRAASIIDPLLVTNTNDAGIGSLRDAVNYAESHTGPDTVRFDPSLAGQTITLLNPIYFNGDSTVVLGDINADFIPDITIVRGASTNWGFVLIGNHNVISHLNFQQFFTAGILISGRYNQLRGNTIGTSLDGSSASGTGNNWGIQLVNNAMYNTVGDTLPSGRNIISGNSQYGIVFQNNADSNFVVGNYIGLNAAGNGALGNANAGIIIDFFPKTNFIGNGKPNGRNIISGNGRGIDIVGSGAQNNYVIGNFIGTNPAGNAAIGNTADGIAVRTGAAGNYIGGMAPGEGNLISGNGDEGIELGGFNNTVLSNFIGTNAAGTAAIPNQAGVGVFGKYNQIGNGTPQGKNVISGNNTQGIYFQNTDTNAVHGNFIGVDAPGTSALPNIAGGILIFQSSYIFVGDTSAGAFRNVISGNSNEGIRIEGGHHHVIAGNFVGTTNAGVPLPNLGYGIFLSNAGASQDTIAYNVVAYNIAGIGIDGASTDSNFLFHNSVFNNTVPGILITGGAQGGVRAPSILTIDPDSTVRGNAAPFALVQIYADSTSEGQYFLDSTYANASGNWARKVTLLSGLNLTALQDSARSTSAFSAPVAAIPADPFVVTSTLDDSSSGTLRYAIGRANATVGRNLITFNLSLNDTIFVTRPLPNITDTLDIDGQATNVTISAMPGYSGFAMFNLRAPFSRLRNFNIFGRGIAQRGMFIDNAGAGGNDSKLDNVDALEFTMIGIQGDAVRDTIMNSHIAGNGTAGVAPGSLWVIENNRIGTNSAGTAAYAIPQQTGVYIFVYGGIKINQNTVSGHSAPDASGIRIVESNNNIVTLNAIGTDLSGSFAIPNHFGVLIDSLSKYNAIGAVGSGNVISGNSNAGLWIQNNGADSNTVVNNMIGTNISGNGVIANQIGVATNLTTGPNFIGDGTTAGRNIISGNSAHGLYLFNSDIVNNNYIGTDVTGTVDFGNTGFGIYVYGSKTQIKNNLISGNDAAGVYIAGVDSHVVTGNFIGTNDAGNLAIPNLAGITLTNIASGSVIGGLTPANRNVISGNTTTGLKIENGANHISAFGNYIGIAADGLLILKNGSEGIMIEDAGYNVIGDTAALGRNIISGNDSSGILITNSSSYGIADHNKIEGNYIGLRADGVTPLGNGNDGIRLRDEDYTSVSNNNMRYNRIAYNGRHGVAISEDGARADSNIMHYNSIHDNAAAGIAFLTTGVQQGVRPPVISSIGGDSTVYGLAAPNAFVQIFADLADEGRYFLDTARANGTGNWSKKVTLTGVPNLTALQDSAHNTSEFSAPFTLSFTPATPSGLFAISRNGQVELKWNANYDGLTTKYRIFYDVTSLPTTLQDSATGGALDTTKIITGLTNGQIYYFRVVAVNALGQISGFSNEDAAVPVLEAGNAVSFNGSNYILSSPSLGNFGSGNFSIEAWIKTTGTNMAIAGKRHDPSNGNFFVFGIGPSGEVSLEVDQDLSGTFYGSVIGATAVNDDRWHHVAAVRNGSNLSIYVDGALDGSAVTPIANVNNADPMSIGARGLDGFNYVFYFTGEIDELRLWNYARNTIQLTAEKNKPLRGDESGLLGLYHFDESDPSVVTYDGSQSPTIAGWVNGSSFLASGALAPLAPTGLNTTPYIDSTITVSWLPNTETDLSHYYVYRSTTNGFTPTPADSIGRVNQPTNWFDDYTAQLGTTYYYRVVAIDSAGQIGAFSNQVAGVYPIGLLSASLSPVNFGNVALGNNAVVQTKVYANGGYAIVTGSSFDAGANFSLVSALTLPDTLFAGDTLYIDLRYTPSAFGAQTDTLRLVNNTSVNPFVIALNGTGTAGNIASNVNPASYGSVPVGNNATQTIKIFSNGGAVRVSAASIMAGTNFTITNGLTFPDTLFAGDTLFVDVQFAPTGFGALTDTLSVVNNSGTPLFKIALDGSGIPGTLATLLDPVNFGAVSVGNNTSQTIKVYSNGGAVRLSGASLQAGVNFAVTNAPTFPDTLFSGDTLFVDVQFAPTAFGALIDTLTVTNNSGTPFFKIGLNGSGASGVLTSTPSGFNFGNVAVTDSAAHIFKLYSTGGAVSVNSLNLNFGNHFILTNIPALPDTLYSGDTLSFVVRFKPTAFGAITDTVAVTNNSSVNPLKIALDGNGIAGTLASLNSAINFGNVNVGNSDTATVKIFAPNGAVRISSVTMIAGSHFTIINPPVLPDTLFAAQNDTLSLQVKFQPLIVSGLSDTLIVVSNSALGNLYISFDGNSLISPVTPVVIMIYPEADARVSAVNPTTNYGADPRIYVFGSNTEFLNNESHGYLRFDLSAIPSNSDVTATTFQISNSDGFAYNYYPNDRLQFVSDDSWNEGTITWNTRPAFTSPPLATWFAWMSGFYDYTFTTTSGALRDSVRNQRLSDGKISFNINNFTGAYYNNYYSKEAPVANNLKPQLIVTYLPATLATLTPTVLFGNVAVGDSATQIVKVFTTAGNVLSTGLSYQFGTNYTATVIGGLPRTLQTIAGDTMLVSIKFKPTTFSLHNDSLFLANNSSVNPFGFALQGTGVPGTLTANPAVAVNYGNVSLGNSVQQTVTVYPAGGAVQASSTNLFNGSVGFRIDSVSGPALLQLGDTMKIYVAFEPVSFGASTDSLYITNNSVITPVRLGLNGTGISGAIASNVNPANYGNVTVGNNATQTIKIFSNGGAVRVSAASILAGTDFAVTNALSLPDTLFAGDTLFVDVRFTPTAFGALTDTLAVTNNSGVPVFKVALSGTGVSGVIASNVNPANYGNVSVGNNAAQTIKIYSNGGAVRVSAANILAGTNFSITNVITLPDTLYAGDTLFVDVQFAPTAFGALSDTLTVSNNSGVPVFKVALNGTGTSGSIAALNNPQNFGNVPLGSNTTQTIKVYSSGGAVRVSGANIFGGANYAITNAPTFPDTLFAGDTLWVDVRFTPTAFSAQTDTLVINNNSGVPVFKVSLNGTGIPGSIAALNNPQNFGNVPVGTSATQTVKVFSTGGGVRVSGANILSGANFTVINAPTLPDTLFSGDTLSVDIQLTAGTFGLMSDTLIVTNNSGVPSFKVALNGTGIPGTLAAIPSAINFGNKQTGDSSISLIKVYSVGGAVSRSAINLFAGTQFSIVSTSGPAILFAGDTLQIVVKFKPLTIGLKNDTVQINNNSVVSPFKIALSGSGSLGSLFASVSSLTFGPIQIGDSAQQSVKIFGSSNGITVSAATLALGAHYSVIPGQALPLTLNIGDTLAATIRFKPKTFGTILDTAQIVNISVNNPLLVSLSGTGAVGTLAPLSANFGLVTIGDSAQRVLKLYSQAGAVIVDSLKFDFGTEFSFTALGTLPDTVFPGDTLFMGVKYKPVAFATTSDTIRVYNNSSQSIFKVRLNGIGNSGTLVAVPASANFGNVLVGDSAQQRLKLYATGANIIVNAGSLETGSDFQIVATSGIPVTLVAGVDTLFVDVKFKPTEFGAISDRFIVTNNSLINPLKVNLTGTGRAGTLSAVPFGYDFGNVQVTDSLQQAVKIYAATGKVIVNNLSLDAGTVFSMTAPSTLPDTLSAGDTIVALIKFKPVVTGTVSDTLRIGNNSLITSLALGLSGTGQPGALTSNIAAYNYGNVKVGSNAQASIKLYSASGQIIINGISLGTSGRYSLLAVPSLPAVIHAGDTVLATIRFTPSTAGTVLDTLYVVNNSGVSPYTVYLTGNGIVNTPPNVFVVKQPANGLTVSSKTPAFSWQGRGDVDGDTLRYTLQISKTSTFSSMVQFSGITDTSFVISSPLDSLGTYYWRVSANDNQGGITVSNTTSFNIDAVSPGLFVGVLASTIQQNYLEVYVQSDETLSSLTGIFTLRDATHAVVSTDTLPIGQLSGLLHYVPYRLSVSGELTIAINGVDTLGNASLSTQIYDITTVTAKAPITLKSRDGAVFISGASGTVDRDGYMIVTRTAGDITKSSALSKAMALEHLLPKALLISAVSSWDKVGDWVRIISTVELKKPLTVTLKYDQSDLNLLSDRYPDFAESKIGIYRDDNGQWIYEGGEGQRLTVSTKVSKPGTLAMFYNSEHLELPTRIELAQNYPNPFNPSTTIKFALPEEGKVKLVIYNVLGQRVRELVNGAREAGYHTAVWNGRNDLGQEVASGLYIYRLETVKGVQSRKMLLVK